MSWRIVVQGDNKADALQKFSAAMAEITVDCPKSEISAAVTALAARQPGQGKFSISTSGHVEANGQGNVQVAVAGT